MTQSCLTLAELSASACGASLAVCGWVGPLSIEKPEDSACVLKSLSFATDSWEPDENLRVGQLVDLQGEQWFVKAFQRASDCFVAASLQKPSLECPDCVGRILRPSVAPDEESCEAVCLEQVVDGEVPMTLCRLSSELVEELGAEIKRERVRICLELQQEIEPGWVVECGEERFVVRLVEYGCGMDSLPSVVADLEEGVEA